MATNRQVRHPHRGRLNHAQEMDLALRPGSRWDRLRKRDSSANGAWTQHRDRVMAVWGKHGKRPWAWWRYELGRAHPGDREASTLYEMGVLAPEERAELERWWRGQFERAQAPDFWLCLGPGRFLEGAPARRAHYKWADVPRELLKEWTRERRRRSRTIRELETAAEQPRGLKRNPAASEGKAIETTGERHHARALPRAQVGASPMPSPKPLGLTDTQPISFSAWPRRCWPPIVRPSWRTLRAHSAGFPRSATVLWRGRARRSSASTGGPR